MAEVLAMAVVAAVAATTEAGTWAEASVEMVTQLVVPAASVEELAKWATWAKRVKQLWWETPWRGPPHRYLRLPLLTPCPASIPLPLTITKVRRKGWWGKPFYRTAKNSRAWNFQTELPRLTTKISRIMPRIPLYLRLIVVPYGLLFDEM